MTAAQSLPGGEVCGLSYPMGSSGRALLVLHWYIPAGESKKAAELGTYVIGVDFNEFDTTFAGVPVAEKKLLLTSVLKSVGVSVELEIQHARAPKPGRSVAGFSGNTLVLDYTNGAVGFAD